MRRSTGILAILACVIITPLLGCSGGRKPTEETPREGEPPPVIEVELPD